MQYTLLWLLAVITNFMSHQKISLDSILVPSTHCSAETFCSELKRQHYRGTNSNNIQSCWISRDPRGELFPAQFPGSLIAAWHFLHNYSQHSLKRKTNLCEAITTFLQAFPEDLKCCHFFKFSTCQMSLERGCSLQLTTKASAFQYITTNLKASQPPETVWTPLLPSWQILGDQNWCRYWGHLSPPQSWDPIVNTIKRREQEKQFLQTLCSCPFSQHYTQSWSQHSREDSAMCNSSWHRRRV